MLLKLRLEVFYDWFGIVRCRSDEKGVTMMMQSRGAGQGAQGQKPFNNFLESMFVAPEADGQVREDCHVLPQVGGHVRNP